MNTVFIYLVISLSRAVNICRDDPLNNDSTYRVIYCTLHVHIQYFTTRKIHTCYKTSKGYEHTTGKT